MDRLREAFERWEARRAQTISRHPERKGQFKTPSGLSVNAVYTPLDLSGKDYLLDLGFPGDYPFTRGVHPSMYRGRFWTMRQYAGYGTPEETNRRFRFLLEQGQTGLSVAFDLPTQMGYDSNHPMAEGEVGRVGVAIDTLADMERLFEGIPLDRVSTSMTINAPAAILLCMYVALAQKQGVDVNSLQGTIQNDILKEYVARGNYIFPPKPSMRLITDTFQYCSRHLPEWNTISISGYHIREAGATAAQEIAFTLANGVEYVRAALASGLDVDGFGPRLSFFFNSHLDFLEEVAKFRAARRLWARIMRERFRAKDPKSWMMRFHTQTAGSTLTAQQVNNNVVRVTLQALAAVLGGTQSLHTNSRDEALSLPTEESVAIALRTQQIIAHESGVAGCADPLGGSYYVESLTDRLESEAAAYMDRIEDMGGAVAAIEAGYMQREIQDSAYCYQREVESGERVVVGVNAFTVQEDSCEMLLQVDEEAARLQAARLAALKARRNEGRVQECLDAIKKAASSRENLLPLFLEAVKAYASLGEICGVLRGAFGQYRPDRSW
ncbi:MAG: methylmalonyl-CoA mutase family protein [Bacillota bacterium]